jgi:hypothetical protein
MGAIACRRFALGPGLAKRSKFSPAIFQSQVFNFFTTFFKSKQIINLEVIARFENHFIDSCLPHLPWCTEVARRY